MEWNFGRVARSARLLAAICAVAVTAHSAQAQSWNDGRALDLVRRAAARRAAQIADTALADYTARAHGYLTFLAQIGEGFTEPPKIVKADELALDVHWKAPNLSKQLIVGRRDTLVLPTDINYHRDHLGIVQNNFPDIIRLGDGDEVRDVPHPVSEAGMREYEFALGDSLELRLGPRTMNVYEIRVRPRNDRLARVVGAIYVERESGDLVRMTLGFTRAALKDRSLEDLTVVLENGLIEGFWLPRRQEIEIRRRAEWLDYPVRTIIRGRWEICCYAVNTGLSPALFTGDEIVQLPGARRPPRESAGRLSAGAILDSLPDDVRAVTEDEVRRIQEEARELVRAQSLAGMRGAALGGRSASDFVRFNRVEGLALGAGFVQRLGAGVSLGITGRYGIDDKHAKTRVQAGYERPSGAGFTLAVYDSHAEAGDAAEVSGFRNSIAAQEFGSDYTDPFGARGAELAVRVPAGGLVWRFTAAAEKHRPLAIHAKPASGRFEPTIGAARARARRASIALTQPTRLGPKSSTLRYVLSAAVIRMEGFDVVTYGRIGGAALAEWRFGARRIALEGHAAAVGGGPGSSPQHRVLYGGPVTAPGYAFHGVAGTRGAFTRWEWREPVPFPSIPLGRFGRAPRSATLAPFAHVAWVSGDSLSRMSGVRPSVGIGLISPFDLIRIDVGRGLRDGRWSFYVDLARDFWPVL